MTRSETIKTREYLTLKLRRVSSDLYRVCDLNGQGSQYISAPNIPEKLRKMVDGQGVIYVEGFSSLNGRWTIRGGGRNRNLPVRQPVSKQTKGEELLV